MSSRPRAVSVSRWQALVPALLLALTGGVGLAAEAPAAGEAPSGATQPATGTLVELDEVWVRGKSLSRLIEEAEDAFFARYNQLNEDDSYDVHCGDISLHRGSMIMTRTCVPAFLADRAMSRRFSRAAGGDYTPRPAMTRTATCYGSPAVTEGGGVYFEGGCYGSLPGNQGSYYSYPDSYGSVDGWDSYYASFGAMGDVQSRQVNASMMQLEAVHRRQEYADTVLAVIQGDAQLQDMARELALLYGNLELTQQRYVKARQERNQARPRSSGPRAQTPRSF